MFPRDFIPFVVAAMLLRRRDGSRVPPPLALDEEGIEVLGKTVRGGGLRGQQRGEAVAMAERQPMGQGQQW